MGQDGSDELILLFDNVGGHFLILHYENGEYYGINDVYRGFLQLQTNGVFVGSGGASSAYYYEMGFENGEFQSKLLGYTDWDDEREMPIYYIGNEATYDQEVFNQWLESKMAADEEYYEIVGKSEKSTG